MLDLTHAKAARKTQLAYGIGRTGTCRHSDGRGTDTLSIVVLKRPWSKVVFEELT